MKFTEDEYPIHMLQDEILKNAPKNLTTRSLTKKEYNGDGTFSDLKTEKTITQARLLSLYTCFVDPPEFTNSKDRILVTGVQIEKEYLDTADPSVKNLFIDPTSNQLAVTGETEAPVEEKQEETKLNLIEIERPKTVKDNLVDFFNKQLRANPAFVQLAFYVSFTIFAASSMIYILIPKKRKYA